MPLVRQRTAYPRPNDDSGWGSWIDGRRNQAISDADAIMRDRDARNQALVSHLSAERSRMENSRVLGNDLANVRDYVTNTRNPWSNVSGFAPAPAVQPKLPMVNQENLAAARSNLEARMAERMRGGWNPNDPKFTAAREAIANERRDRLAAKAARMENVRALARQKLEMRMAGANNGFANAMYQAAAAGDPNAMRLVELDQQRQAHQNELGFRAWDASGKLGIDKSRLAIESSNARTAGAEAIARLQHMDNERRKIEDASDPYQVGFEGKIAAAINSGASPEETQSMIDKAIADMMARRNGGGSVSTSPQSGSVDLMRGLKPDTPITLPPVQRPSMPPRMDAIPSFPSPMAVPSGMHGAGYSPTPPSPMPVPATAQDSRARVMQLSKELEASKKRAEALKHNAAVKAKWGR